MDVGTLIGGRYELERLIGAGAMGEVWLARHVELGESMALKFLLGQRDGDEAAERRFRAEAAISARLSQRSRHIVRVTDYGQHEDLRYLVMERMIGRTCDEWLEADGALDLHSVSTILTHVARGVSVAHAEAVIHRDLKPSNIFVTTDEDGALLVKILDFGVARIPRPARSPAATQDGMTIGTPCYMSPEQALARKVDGRADVWALAATAFELLTGAVPFTGETPQEVMVRVASFDRRRVRDVAPSLPRELDAFFDKALAEDIKDRFQTAPELALAFSRLVETVGVHPSAKRVPPPASDAASPSVPDGALPSAPVDTQLSIQPAGVPQSGPRSWLFAALAALLLLGGVITFIRMRGAPDAPVGAAGRSLPSDTSPPLAVPPPASISAAPLAAQPPPASAPLRAAPPPATPRVTARAAPPPPARTTSAPPAAPPPSPPAAPASPPPAPPKPTATATPKPFDKGEVL